MTIKFALIATLLLWLIVIITSALILDGTEYFSKLSPVFFIGLLGSIFILRKIDT